MKIDPKEALKSKEVSLDAVTGQGEFCCTVLKLALYFISSNYTYVLLDSSFKGRTLRVEH